MNDVVIVSAVRTPIGKFGGSFKATSARTLGTITVKEALTRANLTPDQVDTVIFGNVLQAGTGQNVARQIAIDAGIPYEVPAMTINEVCGSGLKSVILGKQQIQLGEADIVVVGGTENMSMTPHLIHQYRWDKTTEGKKPIDVMIHDGLTDAFSSVHMGITAENVAEKYHVTREEQDAFALSSQMKAKQAQRSGRFDDEIVPVTVKNDAGEVMHVTQDEYPRPQVTHDDLAKLKTPFKENGTVTAGNASGINDGAASLVLMSKQKAQALGIPYLAEIKADAEIGMDPQFMGYTPYYSTKKLAEKAKIDLNTVDLFELNEAFAAQSIPVVRDLGIDSERVNVNGGAIALGHPIGASGARILVTLLHELTKREAKTGIAGLCVGGGIGISMLVERD
ncbi:acetyl-CoA acetyltransferase [Halolactibacillus alkaliphilus]|uniref:acetyl-CoA C-acetyltransferase n=1 Tax=Halolactibacillus alkaliphilus TaxID=442899 RepID=A0A511WZU2_9BACI|nr:acetyl-CoA C-acetyltransferase [Halolactibacillus alkaliphilus]GEN56208.1 acetyl-CoA acetyltransferase [Halolactibacillus alkaliphilus]GGN66563.1 acetyl-CoA acetyltransferase [Halolactibacillus alkaliphilus]SFO67897.1 acetyl-CoA C-acetyltransferase [Halolactibacillus alkaliphilus]